MQNLQSLSIEATADLNDGFGLSTLSNLGSIFCKLTSSIGDRYSVNGAFSRTFCNSIVFDNNGEFLDCDGLSLSNCSNLRSINLSNAANLTSIYNGLFTGCRSLVSVFVPSTVSAILENSLCGCTSLDDNGFAIPD